MGNVGHGHAERGETVPPSVDAREAREDGPVAADVRGQGGGGPAGRGRAGRWHRLPQMRNCIALLIDPVTKPFAEWLLGCNLCRDTKNLPRKKH